MSEILRLSYGSITAYIACPRRYEATYIHHLWSTTSGQQHLGISVHSAIEECLHTPSMTDEQLVKVLQHHFNTGSADVDWQGKSPVKMLGEAEKGIVLYREVLNQLTPANGAIEVKFERRLGDDILLVGKVDAITTNATIVDHKTSRRSPTPWDVPLSLQPTVYALGLELEQVRAAFGYIVFLAKGPRVELHTTDRTSSDVAWLRDILIPQVADGILNGRFPPRPGWHCSTCHVRCDFCGYRSSWGGKIEAPIEEVT